MRLIWKKEGELYHRVYTANGLRGNYRIDLDKILDRWVIYVDNKRCVENIYYIKNAQLIAEKFEAKGEIGLPSGLRPLPDGQAPKMLAPAYPHTDQSDKDAEYTLDSIQTIHNSTRVPKSQFLPNSEELTVKFYNLITTLGIVPEKAGTPWLPWQSGVYALLDCIFSSQSNYKGVVLPLLGRLSERPNLSDTPDLHFSTFLTDIDGFGDDRFEQYARQVLTRNKIAGRLKVEICYEAAHFFVKRGLETMTDLHRLETKIEPLILTDLQGSIRGVGPALSHYLLTLYGNEYHVKLDTMINRFWARMNDWCPRDSNEHDYQIVLSIFRNVASQMQSSPARLDNAIWQYESEFGKTKR